MPDQARCASISFWFSSHFFSVFVSFFVWKPASQNQKGIEVRQVRIFLWRINRRKLIQWVLKWICTYGVLWIYINSWNYVANNWRNHGLISWMESFDCELLGAALLKSPSVFIFHKNSLCLLAVALCPRRETIRKSSTSSRFNFRVYFSKLLVNLQ